MMIIVVSANNLSSYTYINKNPYRMAVGILFIDIFKK